MSFTEADPLINRQGKPRGARTTCRVPINTQRVVVRQLSERAKAGDPTACEMLGLIMIQQGGVRSAAG